MYRSFAGICQFKGILNKSAAKIKKLETPKLTAKFTVVVQTQAPAVSEERGQPRSKMAIEHVEACFLSQADCDSFASAYELIASN